jgi:hypothetical protein
MRTASWVLLTIVGTLTLLGSLASTWVAYSGAPDEFGPGGPKLAQVECWNPEIASAIRGRRATAAAFAAAYATLLLFAVLGPYRRGETWCWWAILSASLLLGALTGLRVPLMGTTLGAQAGLIQLVVIVVALLLDVRRLRAQP